MMFYSSGLLACVSCLYSQTLPPPPLALSDDEGDNSGWWTSSSSWWWKSSSWSDEDWDQQRTVVRMAVGVF
jgi:hypothetical protein